MDTEKQAYASTDDKRTENNIMRHQYRPLTPDEKIAVGVIKDKGQAFLDYLVMVQSTLTDTDMGREIALAKTKIEEAVFWACKGVTK
jgi:hypothetical protein